MTRALRIWSQQKRAISRNEVLWMLIPILLLLLMCVFVSPLRVLKSNQRDYCRNNLKGIAIGCLLYAADYRFFPAISATQDLKPQEVARVYETLIYFKYFDNPEGLVCHMSDEEPLDMSNTTATTISLENGQNGVYQGAPTAPILRPASQQSIFINEHVSYTFLRKRLNSNTARSGIPICGDKGIRKSETPGLTQLMRGTGDYHHNGYNVVYVDGHASPTLVSEQQKMKDMLLYLVWQGSQTAVTHAKLMPKLAKPASAPVAPAPK